MTHLDHRRKYVPIPPRSSSQPHLEQHTARAPDIDFGTISFSVLTLVYFGGGPEHGAAHRCPRGFIVVDALCISETRKFTEAGRVDENVAGFDVLRGNGDG